MQDFTKYDFTLTVDDLKRIIADGENVTVIINGEYYDLKGGEK